MKRQDVYNAWKGEKRQIDIKESFADEVMRQIHQYERAKGKPKFDVQWLIDFICSCSFAKAGLVAAGTVIGFVRIAFVICMFLRS